MPHATICKCQCANCRKDVTNVGQEVCAYCNLNCVVD